MTKKEALSKLKSSSRHVAAYPKQSVHGRSGTLASTGTWVLVPHGGLRYLSESIKESDLLVRRDDLLSEAA